MLRFRSQFLRCALIAAICTPLCAQASVESGIDAYSGGDYARAIHDLLPLAEKGNGDAEYYVGLMYADGQGVLKNDATALNWLLQAAGNANAKAQQKLADIYAFGKGVSENDAVAAYWRWRAAATAATNAKNNLNDSLKNADANKAQAGTPGKLKCATPSYAHDAEHFGDGGTVDVLVLVDESGKTRDASVLNSSDWPRLDQVARDTYNNCSFAAGKVDGKAVPGVLRLPYEWKLSK
jgi:TonB family protein